MHVWAAAAGHAATMRRSKNVCKVYNIGRLRGFGPHGNALSSAAMSASLRINLPAAALSAACSAAEAFGIANTDGLRVRNVSATWRADAPWA